MKQEIEIIVIIYRVKDKEEKKAEQRNTLTGKSFCMEKRVKQFKKKKFQEIFNLMSHHKIFVLLERKKEVAKIYYKNLKK